jgi:hypothetical protein
MGSRAEIYKKDTSKKGFITFVPHLNFSLGYNYSENRDYLWENTLNVNYVLDVPFLLDYTLRMHYKERFLTGISIRLRDAIAFHVGMYFLEKFQVCYSYDLLISKFRNNSSGSHEITLIYSHDVFSKDKKSKTNSRFIQQRYGYLL